MKKSIVYLLLAAFLAVSCSDKKNSTTEKNDSDSVTPDSEIIADNDTAVDDNDTAPKDDDIQGVDEDKVDADSSADSDEVVSETDSLPDNEGEPDPDKDDIVTDNDTPASNLRGECSMETKLGAFVVQSQKDYAVIEGKVADGVVPATILKESGSEGNCKLMKKENPVCTPACNPGETCNFDGKCIQFPLNQNLGTVTIKGTKNEIVMEPSKTGNKYFNTKQPNPPFESGKEITITSVGGAYKPLFLKGYGVDPLKLKENAVVIKKGSNSETMENLKIAG